MSTTKETVAFTMHPQLLYSVIQRQAGTLSKAILEGVMNGVDAKAKKIDITLTKKSIQITDNGKGFKNREEIDLFFRTFGQPHDESEQKIYGAFRMGRGQLFAFGVNHWKTGEFEMHVDIKNKGLDFALVTNKKKVPGCTIDIKLYDSLLPSDLVTIERDLEKMVRYVDVPVTLNKKKISCDPAKEKWDHETADAYIRLKASGGLAVYNLGVFVHEISSYHLGTGGEVVAKKQLKVNFARNDVQSDCPVWKRVKKVVDQRAQDTNVRKPRLDEGARERMAFQWVNEPGMRDKLRKSPLFTDTQGRNWSANKMERFVGWGNTGLLAVAAPGDPRADKLMQQKRAMVLSHETLERFGVRTAKEMLALLQDKKNTYSSFKNWQVVEFKELAKELSTSYTLLAESDLKPTEKILIRLLESSTYQWLRYLPAAEGMKYWDTEGLQRKFFVGISDAAHAWTDGSTYVAVNRDLIKEAGMDYEGLLWLSQIVVHEFTHESPSTAAHLHTPEFYQNYHDSMQAIRVMALHLVRQLPKALEALNKRLTKRQLRDRDREAQATKALEQIAALAK